MAKDSYLRKILGLERYAELRHTRVLMVGAGGIGCELLKNLVLTGFGEIHIVDLDTITLLNLNRQFLFRQKDIDKLKSLTVAQAVQSFNYLGAKLVPHHGNVMDTKLFPLEWWGQFGYIYNALDNLEARRYVNKMALFLRTPLMESGTTGFEGQTQPIFPFVSECFECQPKSTPQTFPVCTIRLTPLQPVHCIVWAKEFLFTQLFDETSEKAVLAAELLKETDDKEEIERIVLQANELAALKAMAKLDSELPEKLVQRVYCDDIHKALRLESLWKNRVPPAPLLLEEFSPKLADADIEKQDTRVWSVSENLAVLQKATSRLQKRLQGGEEAISFDKDDEDTLDFVAAAANLRSHVFHIPLKTKFDIKQIAGNIIPAIATTNAIISGFSALGLLPYFTEQKEQAMRQAKSVFISIKPNKRVTLARVEPPNPRCASLGISKGIVDIGPAGMDQTLGDFVLLVSKTYGFSGDISVILGSSRLIYDYDFDDNIDKKLAEITGFQPGEVVLVQDEEEELENVELYIQAGQNGIVLPKMELRTKYKPPVESSDEMETTVVVEDEPPSKKRRVDVEVL